MHPYVTSERTTELSLLTTSLGRQKLTPCTVYMLTNYAFYK